MAVFSLISLERTRWPRGGGMEPRGEVRPRLKIADFELSFSSILRAISDGEPAGLGLSAASLPYDGGSPYA